jgi:hypothetical protein
MTKEELTMMYKKHKITAKKYDGDDLYSWAVFYKGVPRFTGLSRSETPYYKKQVLVINKLI